MGDVDVDEFGPDDYAVVDCPAGVQRDGSALPLLRDLLERGIIRILDLAVLRREDDGTVVDVNIADVEFQGDVDVTLFAEAASALLDREALEGAGSVLEPGAGGPGDRVREHLGGSVRHRAASQRAQLVAGGRIPLQAILATLDSLEAAS